MSTEGRSPGAPELPGALPAAPEQANALGDAGVVVLAAATAAGAWSALPLPIGPVVVAAAGLAWAAHRHRHPVLLVAVGFLLAAPLGHRALAGLEPLPPGRHSGVVTLVGDPRPSPFGTRVDVRTAHGRFELQAEGAAAGAVEASLAGEQLAVDGRIAAPSRPMPWLVPRHVRGVLRADRAERHGAGAAPWRAANRVRRLLDGQVRHLDRTARSLYAGTVLGDGRHQPPEVVDDFRGAGLTHLLVVSGQNLAFVLVLAGPALRRFGWVGRWAVTVAVVGAFAVVTRFEPSVLRASAMAVVAVSGQALGRPSPSLRNLALAVTALLSIDPLLVRSVAFQLSVSASAAIAWWGRPLAERLRGPKVLRDGVAVTVAAQLGVAPVLIPRFGGLPVASLPANVLAGPVAGVVTTWGLPAGLVAGAVEQVAGWSIGPLVHLPTEAALWWVASVARAGAGAPLGELGLLHVVLLGAAVLAWVHAPRLLRGTAIAVMVVVLAAPGLVLRHPPPVQALGQGVRVDRRAGATVVVADRVVDPARLLEDLRRAGVRRVDELVVGGRTGVEVERVVRHRWPVGEVVVRR